jgi:hypothetical protein
MCWCMLDVRKLKVRYFLPKIQNDVSEFRCKAINQRWDWESKVMLLISVRGWVDLRTILRPEGLGKLKNSVIWLRIEPATSRLIEECFNHVHYLVLLWNVGYLSGKLHGITSQTTVTLVCLFIVAVRNSHCIASRRKQQSSRFYWLRLPVTNVFIAVRNV